MPTLVKHGARELSFAEAFENCGQVKAALARAHGIAPESARLVAKGKTLSDEDSVPDCKMMLFIRGGTSTLSLSLRCLVSGRVVHQVQVASSMRVSELAERATVALGLSGHRTLYLEAGKQLMRADLSLSDYSVTSGTEIFVCPVSRAAEELGAEAEPKLLPLLPPSIKGVEPRALEPVPPTPPAQDADGECSHAGARAPTRMRTGVLGEAAAAAQVQMIPIPIEMLRELQRSEGGVGKPTDIDERALLALIDQQLHATLGTVGILGELPRIEQQQARQEDHLEIVCSKLVNGLQRAQPAEQLGNKPSDAKERRKESASWGKGLSKGFLSRPKKQKRLPAQPPAPVGVVSHAESGGEGGGGEGGGDGGGGDGGGGDGGGDGGGGEGGPSWRPKPGESVLYRDDEGKERTVTVTSVLHDDDEAGTTSYKICWVRQTERRRLAHCNGNPLKKEELRSLRVGYKLVYNGYDDVSVARVLMDADQVDDDGDPRLEIEITRITTKVSHIL